jgi:competence protein ComEC
LVVIVLGGLWLCLWRELWRWFGLLPVCLGMLYPLYVPTPDFFITPDGREWAARLEDGRLAVSNLDHDKFSVDQWQQRLGMVQTVDVTELPADNTQIRCDEMGCIYRHGTHTLAMPEIEAAVLEDCAHADMVIAPVEIKDCAAGHIDDPDLWFRGAHEIYFSGDAMRVEAARTQRGARPWSVGWKKIRKEDDD